MNWISVRDHDKLPKIGTKCLVWLYRRKVVVTVIVQRDKHGLIWKEIDRVPIECDVEDLVTHWLPLIEPPEDSHG